MNDQDHFYSALLLRYGKVYNPEANERALVEKRAVEARRAKLREQFHDKKPPTRD